MGLALAPGSSEITVEEVRLVSLNKHLTADDDEIQRYINAALAEYEMYVGPLPGTVTETLDAGRDSLLLSSPNASAVTAATYADGTAITTSDLLVQNGIVRWAYNTVGRFTPGLRVTVTYTVGALPANHREAITDAVSWYFRSTQRSTGAGQADFPGEGDGVGEPTGELFFAPSWQGVQSRIRALAGPVIA